MRTLARAVVALAGLWLSACPGPPAPPDIPPCGPDTLAARTPLDLLDLATVGPMGDVDPERGRAWPGEGLGFFVRPVDPRLPEGEVARVPVVAPARIWLQRVRHSFFEGHQDEFSATFRICAEMSWTVGHLVFADPQVRALADDSTHFCNSSILDGESSFCEGTSPGLELAPGTELGLAGGATSRTLDVKVDDTRAPPVTFAGGQKERFVCPLDAFDPSIAGALRPLLGTPDGRRRTAEPTCGEYMMDVPGTASGNWFATSGSGTRLALVRDHVDPEVGVIAAHTPFGESAAWRFPVAHSGNVNRDFREVTAGGTLTCYDSFQDGATTKIMLVEVEVGGIQFEQQDGPSCGTGPWSFQLTGSNGFVR